MLLHRPYPLGRGRGLPTGPRVSGPRLVRNRWRMSHDFLFLFRGSGRLSRTEPEVAEKAGQGSFRHSESFGNPFDVNPHSLATRHGLENDFGNAHREPRDSTRTVSVRVTVAIAAHIDDMNRVNAGQSRAN